MASGTVLAADWAAIVETRYAPFFPAALNRVSFAWNRLNSMGKVRFYNQTNIDWRINSEGHSNIVAIDDGETLPSPGKQEYVNAQKEHKILLAMISVGRKQQRNSFGRDSSVTNSLQFETQKTIQDMARRLHQRIVGTASNTKQITGIEDGIADNNTYAGISRPANPFWQSFVNDASGVNRPLTEVLLMDVIDTLRTQRQAMITEAWCGITAWNALRDLINTIAPSRNMNPTALAAGASSIEYEGIEFIKVPDYDLNRIDFLDLESDGGIEYLIDQANQFVVTPESTDAYDMRVSISHSGNLVVWNPFRQGSLQDVQ